MRRLKKYISECNFHHSSPTLRINSIYSLFFSIDWAGSSRGREDDREKVNEKDAPFGDIIVEISHYLCCFYIHSNEIQSQHDIEGAWAIIL